MSPIKIDEVICIKGNILIVFYTPGKCWQFRIISRTGGIFGEQKLYYSAAAALRTGMEWLRDEL
ncbi:hypothetical protein IQ243_27220 [Nostocales cyanobacterium LEGE 11386]|nr:hypothetical protein [Nostocales cyanobacterium LEGE 11386]